MPFNFNFDTSRMVDFLIGFVALFLGIAAKSIWGNLIDRFYGKKHTFLSINSIDLNHHKIFDEIDVLTKYHVAFLDIENPFKKSVICDIIKFTWETWKKTLKSLCDLKNLEDFNDLEFSNLLKKKCLKKTLSICSTLSL